MAAGPTLADFVPAHSGPDSYIANARPPLTRAAWEWLRRMHQRRLVERGALLLIGGRWCVHPARMDAERAKLAREQTLLRCREALPGPANEPKRRGRPSTGARVTTAPAAPAGRP